MKTFACILLGLLAFSHGRVIDRNGDAISRVVNGEDAKPGERPFQVSLQLESHFCGGSIISENWVVTAAHCVLDMSDKSVNVIVGTVNLKEPYKTHRSEKIIVHEKYTPSDSYKNDIALIKVATSFEFFDLVQPVALPEPFFKVKTNSSAVLSGWGSLKNFWSGIPDKLQKATIFIADPEYCRNVMLERNFKIYPTSVCAYDPIGRREQCNGDSGGPLTVDGILTGIVSWSIKTPDCVTTKYPGVYTRVSEYLEWIDENTNKLENSRF